MKSKMLMLVLGLSVIATAAVANEKPVPIQATPGIGDQKVAIKDVAVYASVSLPGNYEDYEAVTMKRAGNRAILFIEEAGFVIDDVSDFGGVHELDAKLAHQNGKLVLVVSFLAGSKRAQAKPSETSGNYYRFVITLPVKYDSDGYLIAPPTQGTLKTFLTQIGIAG